MPAGSADPRFAGVATDPRFRRPKQKAVKVEIDARFKEVLESNEFGGPGSVSGKKGKRLDKYGRPLASSHHQDQLKTFYRLKSPEAGEEEKEDGKAAADKSSAGFVDYARGEGLLDSSGSEDESGEDDAGSDDDEEGVIELGMGRRQTKIPGQSVDTEDEEDEDEDDLDIDLSEDEDDATAAQAIVDAAKKASASASKQKQQHISSIPSEEDILLADAQAAEDEEADLIEPTKRVAIVNLDWDNMRAIDLYTVFNSIINSYRPDARTSRGSADPLSAKKKLVVPKGKLLSVRVFPSEFGKERMAKEEVEGPAAEVFGSRFKHGKRNGQSSRSRARAVSQDEDDYNSDEFSGDQELEDASGSEQERDFDQDDQLSNDDDGEAGADEQDAEFHSVEDEEEGDEDMDADGDEDEDEDEDPTGLDMGSDDGSEASEIPEGDVDMDKLREYQLERLRYYYAIATFSDVSAAEYILNECNGTEFERTANVFDMMYVPDDTDFDVDECRDEATEEAKGYKGNDFVTDALRHSRVKLTWDQDDPNRVKVLRRPMTKQEIEEEDFKAYLASGTDDDDESEHEEGDSSTKPKVKSSNVNKARLQGKALRDLLLNGGDDEADVWGKHGGTGNPFGALEADDFGGEGGEMEVTFKSGLSKKGGAALSGDGEAEEDMTTLERYRARLKEKMNRKKEKKELKASTKAVKEAETAEGKFIASKAGEEDDFFNDDGGDENANHDFFEADAPEPTPASKTKAAPSGKPAKQSKQRDDVDQAMPKPRQEATAEDLTILAGVDEAKHFSMQDIIKAEKDAGKKKRKRSKKFKGVEKDVELGDAGFDINVKDDRFKVLHEEPAFAIDPSNPHFVKTKGMSKLLQEGTKRRQQQAAVTAEQALQQTASRKQKTPTGAQLAFGLPQVVAATSALGPSATDGSGDQNLLDLVAHVKRKLGDENPSSGADQGGKKKRKRR
ncbi:hypothetical protein QFC22_002627 [Naganishia vaughanmartiniae]|uniref:Uncharacterized protein n=1 Tax=Naganishia vaughanmartiniae TaxID=1424756 RepID=A0ACC2XAN0_9TREE|nr:hypothetical protein QFC22_002627 [Naganishia vaughanmartiniae]